MPAIVVEGLERAFDEVLAVQGIDLAVERGRDLRLPRPQRRRQDDHGADADDAAAADRRPRHRRRPRRGQGGAGGARLDRRRPAGSGARPADDRPRADPPAGDPAGHPDRGGQAARRRPARAGRPGRRRRPPRRHLLGRDAAPARPRRGARPRAARPLPRRADHRPRPGQPQDDLGGGAGAERRGHDRLPHHPVPGGGRPARRQRRDHRQRQDRRRGDAGVAEGRNRQPPHPAAARRGLGRRGGGDPARRIGRLLPPKDGKTVLVEVENGAADIPRVVRALDEAGIAVESLELVRPTLDDVFVEKTGYHLEEESEENAEQEPVEA